MSNKWRNFSDQVRMERMWTCQWCLKDHNRYSQRDWLHVHHIIRRKVRPDLTYSRDNLLTLCQRCHDAAERMSPSKQYEATKYFESHQFEENIVMNFYSDLNVRSQEGSNKNPDGSYISLPEGAYTHNQKNRHYMGDDLYIAKYLGERPIAGGLTEHKFLVASDSQKGTAFMKLHLKDWWLTSEAIALAFRKKDQSEIDPAILKQLDVKKLDAIQDHLKAEAEAKVEELNTPSESQADATEKAISSILTQIQINVGLVFRLCDWHGVERNPGINLLDFEQAVFEGSVKYSTFNGKTSAEVNVYSKPANGQTKTSKSTEFDTAKL